MNYQLVKNNEWKDVEINGKKEKMPSAWFNSSLGKLCDVRDGTHESPKFIEKGFPFITTKNLVNGKLDFSTAKFISKEDHENFIKRSNVEEGDILTGMIGTIGNPVMIKNKNIDFSIKNVGLIKSKNKINQLFLFYNFRNYLNNKTTKEDGGVVKFMSLGDLRAIELLYPDENQQKSIASILSKQESIISNTEKLIEKNEVIFNELSEQLLSGELRLKDVDGKVSIYKNADYNWKEVEINGGMKKIPKDWEVIHFEKLGKLFSGKRKKYNPTEIEKENNKFYFSVGGEHVGKNKFNLKNEVYVNEVFFNKQTKGQIAINDLLIIKDGATTGKNMFVFEKPYENMLLNEHVYRFITKDNNPYYVFSLFNGKIVQDILKTKIGGMIPSLNQENFSQIETVYSPCLKEQQLIAEFLLSKEKSVEKQNQLLFKEKEKFDWLLDNLLSGKYLVKEMEK